MIRYFQLKEKKNKIINYLRNFIFSFKTIDPFSWYTIIWNCFISSISIYCFFVFPIEVSFHYERIQEEIIEHRKKIIFFNGCFFVDIILKFNIGYIDKGIKCMKRKQLIKHYLKNSFILDLLSLFSLLFLNFLENNNLMGLLIFMIFFKTSDIRNVIKKIESKFKISPRLIKKKLETIRIKFILILI